MIAVMKSWLKTWTRRKKRKRSPQPPMNFADLGTLSSEEYAFLRELVEQANAFPGDLVEIGTLFGNTTQRLAAWKRPDQKVITVDRYCWNPWGLSPADHEKVTANNLFFLTAQGQVERVKANKNDFYRTRRFSPPPALAFLDAVHNYMETRQDILWARQAGARIICGHDYSPEFPGVRQAVQESGGPAKVVGSVWVLHAPPVPINSANGFDRYGTTL